MNKLSEEKQYCHKVKVTSELTRNYYPFCLRINSTQTMNLKVWKSTVDTKMQKESLGSDSASWNLASVRLHSAFKLYF